jgi:5-methyltetrahydrofolate--homocysteine methyltransferase
MKKNIMTKKMSELTILLNKKILVIDGGMGTFLQKQNLSPHDYGDEKFVGATDYLCLTKPEIIALAHEAYLEAGADIIETNTFGANKIVLGEYGLEDKVEEINEQAVKIARKAAKKYSKKNKPRFVAGSMGPTSKSLVLLGGLTFDDLVSVYKEQIRALVKGGVDYLLIETAMDTLNIKAAYMAALEAFSEMNKVLPIAVSVTIEATGTMLTGQDIEALYNSIEYMDLLYIGLNCGTGPEQMQKQLERLAKIARFPIGIMPNAGMPDEYGKYLETPAQFIKKLDICFKNEWLNLIGGCCGTTPEHIALIRKKAEQYQGRRQGDDKWLRCSGLKALTIKEKELILVGERANVIGSRIFKNLIAEEKYDQAGQIAKEQVNAGAKIIDICVANPDRDESLDMQRLLKELANTMKMPVMIDSQNVKTIELALKKLQGKSIINSVNLENNGELMKQIVPLAKKFGAAVVVGCIKEEMAVKAEDKLKIALEAYDILTKEYGLRAQDIIIDPLVFPCATGDEKYAKAANETLKGISLIKQNLLQVKVILGISNVSFGLPIAGREIVNACFCHLAYEQGMDLAIVNTAKYLKPNEISEKEKKLAKDLLLPKNRDNSGEIKAFAKFYAKKEVVKKVLGDEKLSVKEKVIQNIVNGTKHALIEHLKELKKQLKPIEITNQVLLKAMQKVGEEFNANRLILAEVLQAAEVMKKAVSYLEMDMEKTTELKKGKMVLATVKGDVHDIGKDLVKIIFSNNGYEVVDLGIKCENETIVQAVSEEAPDVLGLSGLLVRSAQQMVGIVKDLNKKGIKIPVFVGGAALSENFCQNMIQPYYKGKVVYCKDVMDGLNLLNKYICNKKGLECQK